MSDYLSKIKFLGLKEQQLNDENFSAVVEYNNLKSGMGTTIGNALRRVLLGHIPGYSIRSVAIAGIHHEFSAVPGVKEDAQQLIMNLKKVVFKGEISKTKASISTVKAGIVTAADIVCSNMVIVNPDAYLCTLSEGFNLKLEMNLEKGVGIVLASQVKDYEIEVGSIACDAFFSPIENVNFEVQSIENGYENLKITIISNGSVKPVEAFKYALGLTIEQFGKQEYYSVESKSNAANRTKKIDVLNPNLFLKIEDLPEIPTRAVKCLKMLGAVFVGDLVKLSKETLMNEPNFGENSLNKLSEKLATIGLSLGMDLPGWPPENLEAKSDDIRSNFIG
jgi:DNA-directed RNA polymerase subunit alpha